MTLEGVSLGPAERPDFIADRIDASLGWSLLQPSVERVTLVRPQLRAALSGTGISFGSLDRLLPKRTTAEPLPAIDVILIDGQVSVDTSAGALRGRIDGSGNLRDGFRGQAVLAAAPLTVSGCTIATDETRISVAMQHDDVRVFANGVLPRVACRRGIGLDNAAWRVTATLPPTLDGYDAKLDMSAARFVAAGYRGAATLAASGASSKLVAPGSGPFSLIVTALRGRDASAKNVLASGTYHLTAAQRGGSVSADVRAATVKLTLPRSLNGYSRRTAGTFVQPLLGTLLDRTEAAARAFDISARVTGQFGAGTLAGTITNAVVHASSGFQLTQAGELNFAASTLTMTGGLAVSGGGLPQATLAGNGSWRAGKAGGRATLAIAPWTVPGAALEALRLEARGGADGIEVSGAVRVSGLLGGGVRAEGLGVPIALRIAGRGLGFGTRCIVVDWRGLTRETVRLDAGAARLCPMDRALLTVDRSVRGGVFSGPLALRGTVGGAPLQLDNAPLRLSLAHSVATLAPVAISARLGQRSGSATVGGRLDFASLSGIGSIARGELDDPASPVLFDDASAGWRMAGGKLAVQGGATRIVDRTRPARFEPLRAVDVVATLAGNSVEAHGDVQLAATRARLLGFTATHDLGSQRGAAKFETGVLTFDAGLQPYQITENLRGIVENVRGPVNGSGSAEWTADTLTTRGSVRIDKLNLATAALGPVEGVDGTIEFDDLLALTSPPGQTVKVARINPGIAVDDGVAVFKMLGPGAVAVESVRWPYAGGTLTLAPVTIRTGDLRRDFLLTVDDLDAELFLQRFEIKNLNVTGRFDGTLPLVFADGKGRIVAGRLRSRRGGGLIQYVGEVGNEALGAGGKLAFDALRRLRYENVALDLDGDLDGELVTNLRFAGKNEAAATLGGPLPIRATGLPFKFNVTVRAPFRALLGTAASFSDVRPLIRGEVQPR